MGSDTQTECVPSRYGPRERGSGRFQGPGKTLGRPGPASLTPSVVGHGGLPICHTALVFPESAHVLLFIPNYLLWPGWLTCLFCGCQTGGDGSFIKKSHSFQV